MWLIMQRKAYHVTKMTFIVVCLRDSVWRASS